jgi:hypothetical protein
MDKMYVLKGKVRTSCPEVMLSSEHLWTKMYVLKDLWTKMYVLKDLWTKMYVLKVKVRTSCP